MPKTSWTRFKRVWEYDQAGRLQTSLTGSEAVSWLNGQQPSGTPTGPYKQKYTYNVWNELTTRDARFWSKTDTQTVQFANARRQDWGYDNAGNVVSDGQSVYSYDAAGRNTRVEGSNLSRAVQSHDGDGQVIKRVESDSTGPKPWHRVYFTSYYLRSTALGGQVLAKLDQNGDPGSEDFGISGAEEVRRYSDGSARWVHQKPMAGSKGESDSITSYFGTEEPDSGGVDVGFSEPATFPDDYDLDVPSYTGGGAGGDPNAPQCYIDGIPASCSDALRLVSLGFASVDPRRTDSWAAGRLGLRLVQGQDLKRGDPRLKPETGTVVGEETIVVNSGSENNHWEVVGYGFIGAGFGLTGGQRPVPVPRPTPLPGGGLTLPQKPICYITLVARKIAQLNTTGPIKGVGVNAYHLYILTKQSGQDSVMIHNGRPYSDGQVVADTDNFATNWDSGDTKAVGYLGSVEAVADIEGSCDPIRKNFLATQKAINTADIPYTWAEDNSNAVAYTFLSHLDNNVLRSLERKLFIKLGLHAFLAPNNIPRTPPIIPGWRNDLLAR